MQLLENSTAALVLACIALQVGGCQRDTGRQRKKEEKDKESGGGAPLPVKSVTSVSDKWSEKEQVVFKGKFSGKDRVQCTWVAAGGDAATLSVKCGSGQESITCRYTARPALCPLFRSHVKTYWKQIDRSLKKQKSLCRDPKALIKAGMCRRAPRSSHFRLDRSETQSEAEAPGSGPEPSFSGGKSCTEKIDQKKLAEEYCNEAWSGFCTFFSMVQSEDCSKKKSGAEKHPKTNKFQKLASRHSGRLSRPCVYPESAKGHDYPESEKGCD